MSVLEELEFILGPSTSVKAFTEIEEEYPGNELDILDGTITRMDLVERAITSILGDPVRIIFQQALKNAHVIESGSRLFYGLPKKTTDQPLSLF